MSLRFHFKRAGSVRLSFLLILCLLPSFTWSEEPEKKDPKAYQAEGVEKFMAGDFKGSVEAFDRYLAAFPEEEPYHWQRGLAQYGAKMYAAGRKQFELHQTVNRRDVENAAWHFVCVAAVDGVEAAKKALIPIEGDARVPMAEIHALFAGTGSEEAVLKSAGEGDSPNQVTNQRCYAHLYLGLYEEALGNEAKALEHYRKAAKDYAMKHYMGETARVYYESREKMAEEKRTKATQGTEVKP